MVHDSGFFRLAAFVLPTALLLGGGTAAEAQGDAPNYELSGGYAFLRDLDAETNFPAGWNVSIAKNLTDSLGVVADVGGNYKSQEAVDLDVHAFLGGARYSFRRGGLTPYAEALVGMARLGGSSGSLSASAWDFAVQGGVGLGFKIKENISLRAGFDLRNIFSEGTSLQELRALAGVSVSFGSRGGRVRAEAPGLIEPPRPETVPRPTPPASPAPAPVPETWPIDEPPAEEGRPPRPSAPVAPARGLLSRGQDSLSTGDYFGAADAFREYLQVHAAYKFTIPVGVYCDAANVAQQVRIAEASPELFVLRRTLRGQSQVCYGLYWGLFASRRDAQQALGLLPSALRARGQAPISVSRLLASSP